MSMNGLFVCLVLLLNIGVCVQGALPEHIKKLDSIVFRLRPIVNANVNHWEINTPVKAWYTFTIKDTLGAPLVEGTVTVTRSGGADKDPITVYRASLSEWKSGEKSAITLALPSTPGIYTYIATYRVVDPDDHHNVFTLTSSPKILDVYSIIERTTVTLGPDGGTVASPKIADAPQITFQAKAFTGEAQVTLEVLAVDPLPVTNKFIKVGHPINIIVKGASLRPGASPLLTLQALPPPKYPHYVSPEMEGALSLTDGPATIRYIQGEYVVHVVPTRGDDRYPLAPYNPRHTDWRCFVQFVLCDQRADYERFTGEKWVEPEVKPK